MRPLGRCQFQGQSSSSLVDTGGPVHPKTRGPAVDIARFAALVRDSKDQFQVCEPKVISWALRALIVEHPRIPSCAARFPEHKHSSLALCFCASNQRTAQSVIGQTLSLIRTVWSRCREIAWASSGKGNPGPIFGLLQAIRYAERPRSVGHVFNIKMTISVMGSCVISRRWVRGRMKRAAGTRTGN